MPRPTFVPTEQQQAALDALGRIARRRERLEREQAQLIADASAQDIPISHIALNVRLQRKTVYRHLGRPMR